MSTVRCRLAAATLLVSLARAQQGPSLAAAFAADCATSDNKFMGAALVQRNGKTIFEGACGLANAEWAVPNTVDTRFRAASIAKNFTASAILLLQQEGKLSVTQPVSAFVADLPVAWQSATIHQLLTHTSGIPSYTAGPIRRLDRLGATPRELLDVVKDKPLQFAHGAKMAYNNSGYILLGMVIEKASGMSYPHFIEQRIFAPAGMKDSGFDRSRPVLARRASGYVRAGEKLENAEPVDATVPWSAGGFYSTVHDLAKWAETIRTGRLILNRVSIDNMFRVYPETVLQGMYYGYGIVIAERFGKRLFYHGGGISGFTSVLQIYPDEGVVIAVMSNLDSDTPGVTPSWIVGDHLAGALFLHKQ